MDISLINIGLAFIEGVALIVSPCILPLLPIILSASITGSKKRPYGIIIGFVLSFAVFTYFSRQIVLWLGVDLNLVRNISLTLLLAFGVIMLSSYLTEKFTNLTQKFANLGYKLDKGDNSDDMLSGIIFGILVGLIWTPCAGPIFAAVIVQSIIQQSSLDGFLIILAFGIGAAIPMLLIAIFGQKIMQRTTFLQQHALLIRKILGVIIIAAVLFMYYGTSFFAATTNVQSPSTEHSGNELIKGIEAPYTAPEISGITNWINSPALQMSQLRGKVVLIDFWAYSCINCIRTLPYVKHWYKDYHDKGLVIIGVHSPEFDFERSLKNVQNAVKENGIEYPVALDNNFVTWQNFKNHYWPAHYLIDQKGNVVYTHFGEGEYDVTENNIRFLLGLNAKPMTIDEEKNPLSTLSPETYFGYERGDHYSSTQSIEQDKPARYSSPSQLSTNDWALSGMWTINAQKIVSAEVNSGVRMHFHAKQVFAVMGSNDNDTIKVKVLLNGTPVVLGAGKDVQNGILHVKEHKLYNLLNMNTNSSDTIELITENAGLELYTFTFGG